MLISIETRSSVELLPPQNKWTNNPPASQPQSQAAASQIWVAICHWTDVTSVSHSPVTSHTHIQASKQKPRKKTCIGREHTHTNTQLMLLIIALMVVIRLLLLRLLLVSMYLFGCSLVDCCCCYSFLSGRRLLRTHKDWYTLLKKYCLQTNPQMSACRERKTWWANNG